MTGTYKGITVSNYADEHPHATVVGEYVVFVTKARDTDPLDPTEDSETGEIIGLGDSSRRDSGVHDAERAVQELNTNPDAVPLMYWPDVWMIRTGHNRINGVWIPDAGLVGYANEAKEAEGSPARRTRMRQYAEQLLHDWNAYANGDVFGYTIDVYAVRHADSGEAYDEHDDYRYDEAVWTESCWGFVGEEYFDKEVESQLDGWLTWVAEQAAPKRKLKRIA
jgi:hypothetical protein